MVRYKEGALSGMVSCRGLEDTVFGGTYGFRGSLVVEGFRFVMAKDFRSSG